MQNYQRHPNLILGIIAFVLLIVSIGFRANRENAIGNYVRIAAYVLGIISWLWSIVTVLADHKVRKASENRHIIWVIVVFTIPLAGGVLYYLLNKRVNM